MERGESAPLSISDGEWPGVRFSGEGPGVRSPPWDPFHYARRPTRVVSVGPISIGSDNVVGVLARVGAEGEVRLLRWASPGARRMRRPDIVEWPVPAPAHLTALHQARTRLDRARELSVLGADSSTSLPK